MAQTLDDFIAEANAVFLGNLVARQYQQVIVTTRPVELLAQYLVAEMRDLYSPASSDRENLVRLISNLEDASARLGDVARCFRELHCKESFDEGFLGLSRTAPSTLSAE